MLLGMGMNGLLALNEPGDSFSNGAHVTDLNATTKSVAPKYFSADMPPLEHGITLGIKNIPDAKLIHLTVFGTHKKDAVNRLLSAEIVHDVVNGDVTDIVACKGFFQQNTVGWKNHCH